MLPEALDRLLASYADRRLLSVQRADIAALLREIDRLHPADAGWADQEIAARAQLGRGSLQWSNPTEVVVDHVLLERIPDLAHLFLHHRDGRLREAALHRLDGPARSPFEVMVIAYRLNDWAEPVRDAADACARRVFPQSDPDILVTAALVLGERVGGWRRRKRPAAILLDLLQSPDIASRFADCFRTAESGPMCRLLQAHLRTAALDPHLHDLAQHARLAGVRALALRTLVRGHAHLREGRQRVWVDKSRGLFRMAFTYVDRPISVRRDVRALILDGLGDPAVAVRRTSLDELIMRRDEIAADRARLIALAADPSPAIRERAAFLLRPH